MEMLANDAPVLSAKITETEQGAWTAHIDVDGDVPAGSVTITVGPESWVGTARPGSFEGGSYVFLTVGGADKLETVLLAKYYFQPTLADVVADIARECGESFDLAASDPALATYQVPCWHRARGEARVALKAVQDEFGGYWRINRAGAIVMLKDELYPETKETWNEASRDPSTNQVTIEPESEVPFARPGISLAGERVVTAVTVWSASGLKQIVQIHDGSERAQDPAFEQADLARRATELQTVYGRLYPSKVIHQDADGTLHLLPDDERMRGQGLTHIPMRHGLPGVSVRVVPGQYVNLAFEQGDPKRPYAALWPDGSSVAAIEINATTKVVLNGVEIDPQGNITTTGTIKASEVSNATISLGTHVHSAFGSPGTSPPPTP